VNLQAFLAKSLTVRIVPDAIVTNSVNEEEQGRDIQLIKRMQLGLEVALKDPRAPVTAQVQYSGKSGNVIFVIKAGQVYGSIGEVRWPLAPPHGPGRPHLQPGTMSSG